MKKALFTLTLAFLATAGGAVRVVPGRPLTLYQWQQEVAKLEAARGLDAQETEIYASVAHLAREGYRLGLEACHERP